MKATSVSVRLRIFLFAFKIPNTGARSVGTSSSYQCSWGPSLRFLPSWTSCRQKLTHRQLVENVKENVSGQLSWNVSSLGVSRLRQVFILAAPPPKQLLLPLWTVGSLFSRWTSLSHSETTNLSPTLLFLSTLFLLHYKSSFSGNWNLRGFLECLCEEVGGRKWQFIGGKGGMAGALCRWAGAHLWWPS